MANRYLLIFEILNLFISTYNKEMRSLKKTHTHTNSPYEVHAGTLSFTLTQSKWCVGWRRLTRRPLLLLWTSHGYVPRIRNQHQRTELVWSVKDYFKNVSFQIFFPFGRMCLGITACKIQVQSSYCCLPSMMDLSLPAPVVYLAEVEKWEEKKPNINAFCCRTIFQPTEEFGNVL